MADLKNALLTAAEEAAKMQDELTEQQSKIGSLTEHVNYLEVENTSMKAKFKNASRVLKQLAKAFEED